MTEAAQSAPRRPSTRTLGFGLATLMIVGALGAYFWFRGATLDADPLQNVPATASAVLHLDVPAVRGSAFWRRLVVEPGYGGGLDRVAERCGFDPLSGVATLTGFAEGEERWSLDHVGFIARGEFKQERLGECVRSVVGEEGGTVVRVDMEGVPAVAGEGDSRAAFLGSDGVVLGHEDTVTRVIGAVRDEHPAVGSDAVVRSLFERVGRGREVVFVGRVPPRWRDAAARAAGDVSLLGELEQVGFGARVSRGFAFGALLRMHDDDAAETVAAHLRGLVEQALARPLVSLSPLGPALRRVNLVAEGQEVNIAGEYDDEQVARLFELAGQLGDLQDALGGRRAAPPPTNPPVPDETLRR